MSLVLDCSATLAFLLDDEQNDNSLSVLKQIAGHGAFVPPLWAFEVGNSLTMAMRRKRINAELRDKAMQTLEGFDIQVDQASMDQAWRGTLELADRYRLTIYDAAYLELAQRRALPLATLDEALSEAARQAGLVVLMQAA